MGALFYYKFIFITELLAAEMMISFRNIKRSHFVLRLTAAIIIIYLVVFLFPLPVSVAYTGWYSCLMFLSFFALTMLMIKFLYAVSWDSVLFIAIVAYTIKHFAYVVFTALGLITNLYSVINLYSSAQIGQSLDNSFILYALLYVSVYVFNYVVLFYVIGEKINKVQRLKLKRIHLLFVSAFAILVDIVLNSFVVYNGNADNFANSIINCCFNILCCLLMFYVQLNLLEIRDVTDENQLVRQMLHQSQEQYELQKTNIDLINVKCHDIKHKLRASLGGGNVDIEEIKKIDEAVSIYDTIVKSGNEVLDNLLTGVSLICKNKDIVLTCMADCKDLSFIKDGDLYALFGNLMDNAIEAVLKIEEKQKRCIALNIHTVNNFVTITVRNYYSGVIDFSSGGLPNTTKEDKDFHGFGLKSIKMLVDNYDGNLSICTDNSIFKINILFPIS